MANTATIPMPTNQLHPPAFPASPAPPPDWLTNQQAILRTAPDGDTAIRHLYADLLIQHALLQSAHAAVLVQLQAAHAPARPARPMSWRPAILTLLRERGQPMSIGQITQALEAPHSLASPLLDMAKAGLLTRTDTGAYAVPPDPQPAAAPPAPPRTKGGRPRSQAQA